MKKVVQHIRRPAKPCRRNQLRSWGTSALRLTGSLALLLMLAGLSHARDSQFLFDPSGNLLSQAAENPAPPQITGQPQNLVVTPGATASFFVVVADARSITYQWQYDGANIPGANSDALTVQNASSASEGAYTVVVTGDSQSVTSASAALMIDSRGCGMPDSWQLQYFGNLTTSATGDADGDGVSNLQEFLDGTNPTNSASALYRLTILSDGGAFTVSPNQASFTIGQSVTITATPPEAFHAWTGDILTRSNPMTLVMNTNKTITARFTPIDFVWTNTSGDWAADTNWSPSLVPAGNDNAIVTNDLVVTLNTNLDCGGLIFGTKVHSPTLAGSGTLTLHATAIWNNGYMTGSGETVIAPEGALLLTNASSLFLQTWTLENEGSIIWSGGGEIGLGIGALITNCASGLFSVQTDGNVGYVGGIFGRIDNAGIFRKSLTAGTTSFANGVPFNNYGTLDLESGTVTYGDVLTNGGNITLAAGATLQLAAAGSATGPFNAAAGSLVAWSGGAFDLNPGAELDGDGDYRVSGGNLVINTNLSVSNFDLETTITGTGSLTVNQTMNWGNGIMSGSGQTVIAPGAILNLTNSSLIQLSGWRLENGGTILWNGAGALGLSLGGVITNRLGAFFNAQNAANIAYVGGAPCRFDNAGTFLKSGSPGATGFSTGVALNNYGLVNIELGTLVAGGGYVSGINSVLNCEVDGSVPGTNYGQLQVPGAAATLAGTLAVGLANGFLPNTNNTFAVVTAGAISGSFSSFSYPSNVVTMQITNPPGSVVVRVTALTTPPLGPFVLSPVVVGTNLQLSWLSVSNTVYRVEFNPDLQPSNWNALPGDVTAVGSNASKVDPLTPSNRFYRVEIVP